MCNQPYTRAQQLRTIDLCVDAGRAEVEVIVGVEDAAGDRFDPSSNEELGVVIGWPGRRAWGEIADRADIPRTSSSQRVCVTTIDLPAQTGHRRIDPHARAERANEQST